MKSAAIDISSVARLHGTPALPTLDREEALKNFVEQSLDGIMLLDEKGDIIEWNKSQEKITGLHRQEVLGRPFWGVQFQMALPGRRTTALSERMRLGLREAMVNEKYPYHGKLIEQEIMRPDRSRRYVQIMPFRVRVKNGVMLGSITRDITERRSAEEALRESEALQRALLDNMNAGVMIVDRETRMIERINRAAARMLGAEEQEVVGRACHNYLCPAEHGKCPTIDLGMKVDNMERTLLRSDGNTVPILETATSITIGGREKLLECFVDITERKRVEENLIKSQKLESLGHLAGGIAHDFNNLLGGIFGYIDLARENAAEKQNRKIESYLLKALRAYERAKDLTRQLLTFARGGAPVKTTGDPGRVVRETAQFALSGSNVKGRCRIAPDLWQCDFDPNQLSQAIDNIVINAKQASSPGGVVAIGAKNSVLPHDGAAPLAPGRYVCITVRDWGPGISREHLAKIFDPFFTTKHGGNGLGLTTSWSIIRRHDGYIDVESREGRGTTFTIYLPVSIGEQESRPDKQPQQIRGHGHVLLMDDEEYICETAASMLRSFGYAVTTAKSGEEAIELFKGAVRARQRFAAVILDLTVPGSLGGKEIVARLLAHDPAAKIIASSGYSEDPIMADPASYGFAASLCKPYRRDEIGDIVARVTTGKKRKKTA